jgi:glycosyltransferase involved in cell wall biosynthesis
MSQSLAQRGFDVEYVGPLQERFQLYIRCLNYFYKHFTRRRYFPFASPMRLKSFAFQARRRLEGLNYDVVVAPNMWGIAYLRIEKPVVLWADCTFGSMVDFYPDYTNLCARSLREGHRAEFKALQGCSLAVFASEWAAESAIGYYNVPKEKVKVVPYGANIICSRRLEDIERMIESRLRCCCKLLFIGKVWQRKGGEIAVEVAKELNRRGLETELALVGSLPDNADKLPAFIKPLGFIDKSKQKGKEQLERLFSESHFLIVPSRAEAYGIVFCEASSYGVPSIATDVGGIPTVVKEGVNGKRFSLTASVEEYASYIYSIMNNYEEYKKLAISSFIEYETRLNWKVASERFGQLITDLVKL